jgi:adenine-specific DNA methylase
MIIPKGTVLYRGSLDESRLAVPGNRPNYLRANLPVYFAPNKENANIYGAATVEYETTRPLRLLDMSDPDTVSQLIDMARSDAVKKSIAKAFIVANGLVKRKSKLKHDIHVAVFICKLGLDGYYAPRLPGKLSYNTFHPEVVLCNSRSVLKVVKVHPLTKSPSSKNKASVNNAIRKLVALTNYGIN